MSVSTFTLPPHAVLSRRLVTAIALLVLGPPLLLLAVLAGVAAVPGAGAAGPAGTLGSVPATLAASDAAELVAVPAALRPDFLRAARDYALPPALLAAIGEVESAFDPEAVGPPVPGGPALGMMQFLPSSFAAFDPVAGATPFDPAAAVLAAARHLLSSGLEPGGAFDAAAGLFGYNHSSAYVTHVLAVAADYGYRYDNGPGSTGPAVDPVRYHQPLPGPAPTGVGLAAAPVTLPAAAGTAALACVRSAVVTLTAPAGGRPGSVVLRGEDGFLYTYAGLATLARGLRAGADAIDPGTVLQPGTPLGTTAGALAFGLRRDADTGWLAPGPLLAGWPSSAAFPAFPAFPTATATATSPAAPPSPTRPGPTPQAGIAAPAPALARSRAGR